MQVNGTARSEHLIDFLLDNREEVLLEELVDRRVVLDVAFPGLNSGEEQLENHSFLKQVVFSGLLFLYGLE